MNEYVKRGFEDREDYLLWLAITDGVPVKQVTNLARGLGESEDFGALPVATKKLAEQARWQKRGKRSRWAKRKSKSTL